MHKWVLILLTMPSKLDGMLSKTGVLVFQQSLPWFLVEDLNVRKWGILWENSCAEATSAVREWKTWMSETHFGGWWRNSQVFFSSTVHMFAWLHLECLSTHYPYLLLWSCSVFLLISLCHMEAVFWVIMFFYSFQFVSYLFFRPCMNRIIVASMNLQGTHGLFASCSIRSW